MVGMPGRSGGKRDGAGRKRGVHNSRIEKLNQELARQRKIIEALGVTAVQPSIFLLAVMSDPEVPVAIRVMAARAVLPFRERRPDETSAPFQIPLMRFWTSEQKLDYDERLVADMRQNPGFYSPEFREAMGVEVSPPLLIEAQPEKE